MSGLDFYNLTGTEFAELTAEQFGELVSYALLSSGSSESLGSVPGSSESLGSVPGSSESLGSDSLSCADPEFHPQGRQGIGVAQPQSGTDYPFVQPSEDIRHLVADLYVEYIDPADYYPELTAFRRPFRLAWLYGIGCLPPGAPGGIVQSNPVGLRIVDADGREVIAFGNGAAETHTTRPWGDRLVIHHWAINSSTCTLVVHTSWPETDEPAVRDYPYFIEPEHGELDERVCYRLPKRVHTLSVVLDQLSNCRVDFVAGYNMNLRHSGSVTKDGGRWVQRVTLAATAGAGLGVYPGCDPQPLYLRRINGVGPTAAGDFHLGATDCYWARPPLQVITADPRTVRPAVPLIDPDIPEDEIDPAILLPHWPETAQQAHLQLGGDCPPCCPCEQYSAVAQYLNRTRDRYWLLGREAEATRDQYHLNRDRWLLARECFHRRPLRLAMQPQRCPFLDVVAQFCNQSADCQLAVTLQMRFTGAAHATILPGYTFITGAALQSGRTAVETQRYDLDGVYPTLLAHWDAVPPAQSATVRFRLDFGNCDEPRAITCELTGTVGGQPIMVSVLPPATGMEPASVTKTKVLACPPEDDGANHGTYCPPPDGELGSQGSVA